MKNLTLLFALGLILVAGCTKDESYKQIEEETINSVFVLNQLDGSSSWETMPTHELQNSANRTYFKNNGNDAHTNGYYAPASRDAMTITWSGTQTINGGHGMASIQQSTPNFSFDLVLETECVTADGNQAVYGGTITQIKALAGNTPPIGVGWRFYFKVIDSEHMDQIANCTMFASPMSPSLCNAYLPNNQIWSSQGYTEVMPPGYVVVKNISKY